jgi:hypothetical protein
MRLKNRILILERLQNIEWRALGTLALLVHICMYVNVYIYIYICCARGFCLGRQLSFD